MIQQQRYTSAFEDSEPMYGIGAPATPPTPQAQTPQPVAAPAPIAPAMTVNDLYTQVLGRAPDEGGLAYWQNAFGTGSVTPEQQASFMQAAQGELANRSAAEQQQLAPNLVNQAATVPQAGVQTNVVDPGYGMKMPPAPVDETGYMPNNPPPPPQPAATRTPDQIQQDIIDQERQRQSEEYYWKMSNQNRAGTGTTVQEAPTGLASLPPTTQGMTPPPPVTPPVTSIPNDANAKTVNDLYASIGRTGMGTATNQIDQGGFDYWKQKLDSGMTPEQVKAEFQSTVNDFLTNKKEDAYSQYVAPTYLKTVAQNAFSDTTLAPWERDNKVFEAAQSYGLDDKKIDTIFGKENADKYRAEYGAGIKDYITKTIGDTTKSDFDKAADIHNAAAKYGLDSAEVAKYSGLNPTGVDKIMGAYDSGLANIAKSWEAAKTTAGTDPTALSTAEANKAKTMLALQSQYKVSDEDLAKATGTSVKDVQAYLTPVKQAPETLKSLVGDATLTGDQIKAKIEELKSNPAVSGLYGAALDKFAQSASKTYSGDYNRKQYDSLNPLAVDNVLAQLKAQQAAGTAQFYQGGASSGKKGGFGSLDAVTEDMAKNLVAAGITDIRQVGQAPKYQPVDVIGKQYNGNTVHNATDQDGNVLYQYYFGQGDEVGSVVQIPKDAKLTPLYGTTDGEGNTAPIDTSLVTMDKNGKPVIQNGTQTVNKVTGEPLSKASNYGERTSDKSWSGTYKGAGNTGYDVQFDKSGNPIFYTHGESSNNMADFAPILAMASFIPGAAPFVAAINAAYAAQQGNLKGALLSGLSAAGPLAGMAGASADTVANIGTASKLANVANAISNKDLLGTIMSGVSAASDKNLLGDSAFNPAAKVVGDFSTKDILGGVSLANALKTGDLTTLANVGAQMSGSQDAITAAKGLTLMNAVKTGNPMAIASAVQKMNTAQQVIGKAGGGLASLPGLIKNGNKNTLTDKSAFDGLNGSLVAKMLNQQPPAIRAAMLKKMAQTA